MSVTKDDKYAKNRKRLYKVLGKEVEFSAKKGKVSYASDKSCCLEDVKYRGKIVADHIWVSNTVGLKQFKRGEEIHFLGTAKTYRDKKNVRKLGIGSCYGYYKKHPGIEKYLHDKEHAIRRVRS